MRHPISKHCVVAKVLLLKDLQEAWMVRQVEQEVAILSRLKHANVIQYIATFQAAQHGHTCRHGRATAMAASKAAEDGRRWHGLPSSAALEAEY